MSRIAAFVDAAHLNCLVGRERVEEIDYAALVRRMSVGNELMRAYYYDALPFRRHNSSWPEQQYYNGRKQFFARLSGLPRFTVRLGQTEFRGHENGKPIYVQKRVDVFQAVDLVLMAAKRIITDAAFVAGDSDFIPAIKAAQDEGVVVHLFHGRNAHQDLLECCDERTLLTDEFLQSVSVKPVSRIRNAHQAVVPPANAENVYVTAQA